ncbi:MAG: HAMP domain-containing protein, partial [Patescibacteria group bacterium]|nr:HAMP domain-containing protein [Patescibacteria group bacterium]
MRFKSLKIKSIVYIVPLILFVSLSFLTFFIYKLNHLVKEELISSGFHLVEDLSRGSELAITSEDPVLVEPIFTGIFGKEDVILVTVYNKKGYIIASKRKTEIEEGLPKDIMEILLTEKKELKRIGLTKKGKKIYDFFIPIFAGKILSPTEERQLVGFARVGLSLERIAIQNKAILRTGSLITALIIFLGFSIAFFLASGLTRPIRELTKGVKTIGKGNFDYRIKIKTGDEIEEVGKAINKMVEDLEKSHAALEEAKTVLEIKVEARTRELSELAEQREEII